jgi:hypothetical protein
MICLFLLTTIIFDEILYLLTLLILNCICLHAVTQACAALIESETSALEMILEDCWGTLQAAMSAGAGAV